jgi:hypothetical protein
MFEIAITAVRIVLESRKREMIASGLLIPSVLPALSARVKPRIHNAENFTEIRKFLFEEHDLDPICIRISLQLITFVPSFLFRSGEVTVPLVLRSESLENICKSKDLYGNFQKAIQEVSKVTGLGFVRVVSREMFDFLKLRNQTISKPQQTGFATVAQWFHEIASSNKVEFAKLRVFLEALKPMTKGDLIWSVKTLNQPVHPAILEFVRQLAAELDCREIEKEPSVIMAFMEPSCCERLAADCWRTNWALIDKTSHLEYFVRLLLPLELHHIIRFAKDCQLAEIVSLELSNLSRIPRFSAFMRYYSQLFTDSSLAGTFWLSDLPLPGGSLLRNLEYLHTRNFCEDLLGMLKVAHPQLSKAIACQQISNYRAAFHYYLGAMWDYSDDYFFGLTEVRKIAMNMTLPICPNLYEKIVVMKPESHTPDIHLPFSLVFSDDYNFNELQTVKGSLDLSTQLNQTFLPFLLQAALSEELYTSLKALQQGDRPLSFLSDLAKPWVKSLDKQTAVCSALTWRLTVLHELQSSAETAQQEIVESIRLNRTLISQLLLKFGSIRSSLRFFLLAAQPRDRKQLYVTPQNLIRLHSFVVSQRQNPCFSPLECSCRLLLRDFAEWYSQIAMLPAANMKQWLVAICQIVLFAPRSLEPQLLFARIHHEISANYCERSSFLFALGLAVVRTDRQAKQSFGSTLLHGITTENFKALLIRWLPHILCTCEDLPDDLLLMLFRFDSSQFLLSIQHAQAIGKLQAQSHINELFQRIKCTKDLSRLFIEDCQAFHWVTNCEDDIALFANVVDAHLKLYQQLASRTADGEGLEELAEFCARHRPVFTTRISLEKFQPISAFRFPFVKEPVLNIRLEADGLQEARLRLIASRGETRYLSLLSPRLYDFSPVEHIFISIVSRMIGNRPSSKCRNEFLYYPSVFLLNPHLMLVSAPSIVTQANLADAQLPKLMTQVSMEREDDSPRSFLETYEKIKTDRDFLFDFFNVAAQGSKMNFLFMRMSLASHLGGSAVLRFFFDSQLPTIPSLCFCGDRLRSVIPGFFDQTGIPQIPMMKSLAKFLPKFLWKGSFVTSWQTVCDVFASHASKIRILLTALVQAEAIDQAMCAIDRLATVHITLETERVDEPFPFRLLDHLIDTASNSMLAQSHAVSWI